MFSENPFDGIARDGPNSQLPYLAQDSGVAPLVLSGQFDYQKTDLLRRAPTSAFHGRPAFSLPLFTYPANDGIRGHDGH